LKNFQEWTLEQSTSDQGSVILRFRDKWLRENKLPDQKKIVQQFKKRPTQIILDTSGLTAHDSAFIALLLKIYRYAQKRNIPVERQAFPTSLTKLLDMALSAPIVERSEHTEPDSTLLYQTGMASLVVLKGIGALLWIIGATLQSFLRYLTAKVRLPFKTIFSAMEAAGPNALAIVSLVAFLIGITTAFIGAQEMQPLGAGIYVANLVVVGLARELAPLMTAIVMAGRTGAAIAAEIGSMKADDEIDALITMGIRPLDYLVTTKVIALMITMPLLVAYANILGNIGGILVAIGPMKLSFLEYMTQARSAFTLTHFVIGLIKALFFGFAIAIAGSLRGLQCERSAESVGQATTSAVVTSLILIIVINVLIDFVLNIIKV
jgi:phospholipid/cholesterol/gamma-HCH transport system permease protein